MLYRTCFLTKRHEPLVNRLGIHDETGFEAFYNAAASPWLHVVTADVQYIDSALTGVNLLGPLPGCSLPGTKEAWVVGMVCAWRRRSLSGLYHPISGKIGQAVEPECAFGRSKNIQLSAPLVPGKKLGNLRVTHLLNEEKGKELTFYELTWSEITRQEKALLAFDNSGEYDFRRARINSLLKKFSNYTGPDPIIYLGQSREAILAAFGQSFCWMANRERMVSETSLIAFSDPNDLLSYGIPPGYKEKYLDSRLCANITNVNINIAKVMDAFGLSDLANPLEAHVGYDQDDRVIALIAHGIGNEKTSPLIKQRCEYTKTVE